MATFLLVPSPASAAPESAEAAQTITLVTGDRFLVAADGRSVSALPSPGRTGAQFLTHSRAGRLEVLPVDAVPLVGSGRVDRRLFDVTTLLELGYDDTRAGLPLFVSGSTPPALRVQRRLPSIGAVAVEPGRAERAGLWASIRDGQGTLRLNGVRRLLLDRSTEQVGAPTAWAAGFTGAGVPVGVIDDGIDAEHPDLAGRVVARDFTGTGLGDESGHATHVSSTIAGSGSLRGVAPGATIHSAKACTRLTSGIGCPDDAVLAAMQWLAAEAKVRVVNMSLGGRDEAGQDVLEEAVDRLTAEYGTLFVVAAGNNGIDVPVSSPATADSALAVGAVNRDDAIADYSSTGPRLDRGVLKPEITAPGTDILAAKAYGRDADAHQRMTGTSMATPHVAGAAAVLAEQHPQWTAADLKAALMASASPGKDIGVYRQGAGRLDVGRAINQTVTTVPASVNVDDSSTAGQVVARTVEYRNAGPKAVTLRLKAPKPFTVDQKSIRVPAGGVAGVRITSDTTAMTRAGLLGGQLTATGPGGLVVRTPVGVDRQPRHTLTVTHTNRAGQATNRARVVVAGLDNEFVGYATELRTGVLTANLPAGRYVVSSTVMDSTPVRTVTMLTDPEFVLDGDRTLDMDARLGAPMNVTLQRPDATPRSAFLNVFARVASDGGTLGLGIGGVSFAEIYTARLGTGSARHVDSKVSGLWSGPGWTAAVALSEPRKILQGYARQVRDREFAAVHSTFAAATTARSTVTKVNIAIWPDFGPDNWGGAVEVDLPATRTDYYASEGGAEWQVDVNHNVAGSLDSLPDTPAYVNYVSQDSRVYVAGRSYDESWNKGVFGPAFPAPRPGLTGLTRTGDQIDIAPVMYSDDQGRSGSSSTVGWFQRLTRDGQVIQLGGRVGPITVPAADARYEVFVNTGRKPLVGMATQNQVAWTFRSGPAAATAVLPVSVLRFRPSLDDHNRADSEFLPIEVRRQPGATPATVTAIQVQYSTDDGVTWTAASVDADGTDRFTARVPVAGYVSLQTTATLSDGGTVSQKILRAYLSVLAAPPIGR